MTVSVLMVCLGNICRSPLAEAALRRAAEEAGLEVEVDSAGTGDWHVGHPPDRRAQAVAQANGVDITHYRARQLERADYDHFDHIVGMDRNNLQNAKMMQPPGSKAKVSMLLDYLPGREGQPVPDPYYGDDAGFDAVWRLVVQATTAFLPKLYSMSGFS